MLLLIVAGTLAWLDTAPGHRFLVARIAKISPPSGLRIHVDRIDGSIYRKAVLHGLTLSDPKGARSEEHTSELQSLMRISYAVFCLKKKTKRMQVQEDELYQK